MYGLQTCVTDRYQDLGDTPPSVGGSETGDGERGRPAVDLACHGGGMDAEFGCERCYRNDDAGATWAYYIEEHGKVLLRTVEADSHFSVSVVKCAACAQLFVWIFNELVDWEGGDDQADILIVPVTADEAKRVRLRRGEMDMTYVRSLGDSRR